jgi:predicted nucleic acid-binding protein
MENNIYFDTNIFIDLLDSTRPCGKGSMNITRELLSDGKLLYINSDTVTNAFYVLSRTKRYEPTNLLSLMKKTLSLFTVVAAEDEEVITALSLCEDENTAFRDYEDALQYVCAKKIEADMILTNDKGFVGFDIELKDTKE